jgi:fluoride ion exporter CrcB/FEX
VLALESWRLVENGSYAQGLANLIGSMVLGIVAVVGGLLLGRAFA